MTVFFRPCWMSTMKRAMWIIWCCEIYLLDCRLLLFPHCVNCLVRPQLLMADFHDVVSAINALPHASSSALPGQTSVSAPNDVSSEPNSDDSDSGSDRSDDIDSVSWKAIHVGDFVIAQSKWEMEDAAGQTPGHTPKLMMTK
ncbi:hypothetical protein B0H14DRAFT_3594662 [Mycena olivaceomarginata]|nr:hypothetical protein B0H14DRAFT_3594662 [Mycena olivaceomarginata]